MYRWNQSYSTGGYIEAAMALPSLSGTAGLRAVVWARATSNVPSMMPVWGERC